MSKKEIDAIMAEIQAMADEVEKRLKKENNEAV
jgi:ElaB/YqjD/DUF883 family membrane-anchored ribosome-binding protein